MGPSRFVFCFLVKSTWPYSGSSDMSKLVSLAEATGSGQRPVKTHSESDRGVKTGSLKEIMEIVIVRLEGADQVSRVSELIKVIF